MSVAFHPAGDLAVLVELEGEIGAELNMRLSGLETLVCETIAGVTETVPAFRSLLVYYDPRAIGYRALCEAIAKLLPRAGSVVTTSRVVELPCCYDDPELGFDLDAVAHRVGLTTREVVALHSGAEYLVYFIGFAPGQPYLTGTPARLNIPRLESPRTSTPPGSVAIGGVQSCIYAVDSPGGFWVIGRTPVPIYDPTAGEPTLLRPGDRLRFHAVARREYERVAASLGEGRLRRETVEGFPLFVGGEARGVAERCRVPAGDRVIVVLDGGPQTTVQDRGRPGQLRNGIPPSGPLDRYAFWLANRLVGNDEAAAALECTLIGPRFEVHAACAIAVTGAEMPVTINGAQAPRWTTLDLKPGDVVKVGAARTGVRGYIAFSGGLDVPLVLRSRATYLRGTLGGFEGRALRKGDRLSLLPAARPRVLRVAPHAIPDYTAEAVAHVVLGPQADRFTDDGIAAFLGGPYEMLPQADRMGARLKGARVAHTRGHDIVSDGIPLGAIQITGDGQPIVLLADRQSTGGYTKLATVCSFDVGRVAQVRPGRSLRFQAIGIEEAQRLYREREAALAALTLDAA